MKLAELRPELESTLREHQLQTTPDGQLSCKCGMPSDDLIGHQAGEILALGQPEPVIQDLSAEVERLTGDIPELVKLLKVWAEPNQVDPTKYYWQLLLDAAVAALEQRV